VSDNSNTPSQGQGSQMQSNQTQSSQTRGSQWEARITFLRSRAAVARAEVSAIEAMHRDPEVLEDLLANASPDEVAMAEAVEHRISERVLAARQIADAAEADYERAVLDGADGRDTVDRRLNTDTE
jgi:hypothetical protein